MNGLFVSFLFMFIFCQLKNANNVLDQAQQPYNYLIDSIRQREVQVQKQREHITTMEEDIRFILYMSPEVYQRT